MVAVNGVMRRRRFWPISLPFALIKSRYTLWTLRRIRKRRKQRAVEKANAPMAAVIKVVPDRWADQVSEMVADGTWKRPAAYAGAAWMVMKLAETRQLRKMNKLLASRA